MLDLDEQPRRSPLNLILGLVALALVAVLGAAAFDRTPPAVRARLGFAPEGTLPTAVADPTPVGVVSADAETGGPAGPPAPGPSPSPPPREDHYWLIRPIGPTGNDWVDYS